MPSQGQAQGEQQPKKKKIFKKNVAFESTKQTYRAQVDTNVVSVALSTLNDGAPVHTGDAVLCTQCHAVFSHLSKVSSEATWQCEFCEHVQACDLFPQVCIIIGCVLVV